MGKPVKEAVAAVIYQQGEAARLLVVRRPEGPQEELPGIWGLPAATLSPAEGPADALRRLGRQKLGLALEPVRLLAWGCQEREGYILHMWLYEAIPDRPEPTLAPPGSDNVTRYTDWRWAEPEALREGAQHGSLCCQLLLQCWP